MQEVFLMGCETQIFNHKKLLEEILNQQLRSEVYD